MRGYSITNCQLTLDKEFSGRMPLIVKLGKQRMGLPWTKRRKTEAGTIIDEKLPSILRCEERQRKKKHRYLEKCAREEWMKLKENIVIYAAQELWSRSANNGISNALKLMTRSETQEKKKISISYRNRRRLPQMLLILFLRSEYLKGRVEPTYGTYLRSPRGRRTMLPHRSDPYKPSPRKAKSKSNPFSGVVHEPPRRWRRNRKSFLTKKREGSDKNLTWNRFGWPPLHSPTFHSPSPFPTFFRPRV